MAVTGWGRRLITVALLGAAAATCWADAPVRGGEMLAQRGTHRGGGGQTRGGVPGASLYVIGPRAVVKARVTAVDAGTGHLVLAVDGTTVKAQFPPDVVADVKLGDDVLLTVLLIDTRLSAVNGPVTAVDSTSGAVTVATPEGPWTVTFSPDALTGIKPGDQAVLKLDVIDLGPPMDSSTPVR